MRRRFLLLLLILALAVGNTVPVMALEAKRTLSAAAAPQAEENDLRFSKRYWYEHAESSKDIRCGIDVSEWQGSIDWAAVAESGVEFAYIRTSARSVANDTLFEDARFRRNLKEARANGIIVGAYIFSQATTPEEARQEARFLVETVSGFRVDLPLVLDYEFDGTSSRLYQAGLSPEQATEVCLAFCEEVREYGYSGMIYANRNMLFSHLVAERLDQIWLANYDFEDFYTEDYPFWQFSSSGSVPGIRGRVDLDFWFVEKQEEP